ncbi:hypothetical protein DFR52_102220 [Hoeflea marina]|uniref:DUF1772 domain-containing protein n=1 Tax=Hoeflea marina TaxID=274592 RepID=A0A317PLD4_9HYPH|nr:hypothetical protein [Hoeflea marina]PWW01557.1 hypothetical protein DFR52_102220 [Hoeflea marina]
MLRLWPGWLLCAATAGLLGYMLGFEGQAISAMIGLPLPDAAFWPQQPGSVSAWREAFLAAPQAPPRYLALHAGPDRLLPPLLTLSLGFLGFAALAGRARPLMAVIAGALSTAAAFPYMLFDLRENAAADALFSPRALAGPLDPMLAAALPGLTLAKFLTLYAALLVVTALWIWRLRQWRRARS